ncbi:MAG: hypothetical protein ABIF77_03260 [bacterium]
MKPKAETGVYKPDFGAYNVPHMTMSDPMKTGSDRFFDIGGAVFLESHPVAVVDSGFFWEHGRAATGLECRAAVFFSDDPSF